jgi:Ca2+-binding RTX toxin-like protein
MRLRAGVAAVTSLLFLLAGGSPAAANESVRVEPGVLVVDGDPARSNGIEIEYSEDEVAFIITDFRHHTVPVTSQSCEPLFDFDTDDQAVCDGTGVSAVRYTGGRFFDRVEIDLDVEGSPPTPFPTTVDTGAGPDSISLFGGTNATVHGGPGRDRMGGGQVTDTNSFFGDGGRDRLFDGNGNDLLDGGTGPDRLRALHAGADQLLGGSGNDRLVGDDGIADTTMDCGTGAKDRVRFDRALDSPIGCERSTAD